MTKDDDKRTERAILEGIKLARLDRQVKREAQAKRARAPFDLTYDKDPEEVTDAAILRQMPSEPGQSGEEDHTAHRVIRSTSTNGSGAMGRIREHLASLTGSVFGLAAMAFYFLMMIGYLYWLWIAIQSGSFFMFVVGLIPPLMVIAAPLGAWCLLFGIPDWVVNFFIQ